MPDYVLPVRRAALKRLKGNAPLRQILPAESMYPGTVPAGRTFPFSRFGALLPTPFRASGLDSSEIRFTVQAFTKAVLNAGGAEIETAEDRIIRIGGAIKDALDGEILVLEGSGTAIITWISSSPRKDGDEDHAWMTTVSFRAEVAG